MRSSIDIVNELSRLNFSGRGEAFVEAKFIAPLLEALGYETHRDYEVIRHGDSNASFKLRYPSVESGAKPARRYNPDFIPTIRKKMFWIIEAKTPQEDYSSFPGVYVMQGLQYCIHPEIQAKYLLISNGRLSSLFDVQGAVFLERNIYDPILTFRHGELPDIWVDLHKLLSVEFLRSRIEDDLQSMFDKLCLSSLDANYPNSLITKVGASRHSHIKTIEAHLVRLKSEHYDRVREDSRTELSKMSALELNELMDFPPGPPPNVGQYIIPSMQKEGKSIEQIISVFIEQFQSASIFRKEQILILLGILYNLNGIEHEQKTRIKGFCQEILDSPLTLLSQVECALLRINRKTLVASHYPLLRDKIQSSLTTAPEIIRFVSPPTALNAKLANEILNHNRTFKELSSFSHETHLRLLPILLDLESQVEVAFRDIRNKLPHDEIQIGGFEFYGLNKKHYAFANVMDHYRIITRSDINTQKS